MTDLAYLYTETYAPHDTLSHEGARELEAKIRSLGKDPATSGTATGALHRAWTNIKSSVTGMDDYAVLAECERGEDVAKRVYEEALVEDLPAEVGSCRFRH